MNDFLMNANNFYCEFNMPPALKSRSIDREEVSQSLPPYARVTPYLVDEYPACPSNWLRSEGKISSYFVPVKKDKGMWLDFNANSKNDYHVAIVISIQGVNAITGLPCKDAHLEQYIENCPKCNDKFGPNRLCKKCGFKYPKQNYICTTGTQAGLLWIDGFRTAEGIIRQYILTEDKVRGVASNVIGEERVFAIGISFFRSKEKKPKKTEITYRSFYGNGNAFLKHSSIDNGTLTTSGSSDSDEDCVSYLCCTPQSSFTKKSKGKFKGGGSSCVGSDDNLSGNVSCYNVNSVYNDKSIAGNPTRLCDSFDNDNSCGMTSGVTKLSRLTDGVKRSIKQVDVTEKLEIGAGARIDQSVFDDPESLDFWREEPEAILCINYAMEKDVNKILEQGKIDLNGSKEGFLQDMPVGN